MEPFLREHEELVGSSPVSSMSPVADGQSESSEEPPLQGLLVSAIGLLPGALTGTLFLLYVLKGPVEWLPEGVWLINNWSATMSSSLSITCILDSAALNILQDSPDCLSFRPPLPGILVT